MDSPLPPNPYKTLNVAQDAPLATVKSAYRKLVLTCHPDKFQDEAVKVQKQEQFHEVQQAYDILSDETRRQRYNERVKLAELRAEMMKEKGGSRVPQEYGSRVVPEFSARPKPSPVYEVRGDRVYEERVPSREYEEDVFSTTFQEHRPVPRKYDDRYSPPTSRRSSARVAEERRRPRDDEERYVYTRPSAKAAEKSTKHNLEEKKRKDKDKRKDREAKFTSKSPYVEEYESDSDATERVYIKATPRHRHDDMRRRDRDEPRRTGRHESSDHSFKLEKKTQSAEDYINQKREAAPTETETRRPSVNRNFSSADFETRAPYSSAPLMTPVDSGRRSGRSREARNVSPIRRRATEIVDPSRKASSDPRLLKNMITPKREPLRASTMPSHPAMRRSDTTPNSSLPRRAETHPIKPKAKNLDINDSGYSSPDTPEQYAGPTPSLRRTKTYQVSQDDDGPRIHNVIYVEPDEARDRHDRDRERERERERDFSPPRRRQTDRPGMVPRPSSNARSPLQHSSTFSFPSDSTQSSRAPPFTRAESNRAPPLHSRQSSRGSHQLYGEFVPQTDEPYRVVHESPRFRSSDISYSRRSPEEPHRDSYPGSHFESRHRPSLARNEKAY